MPKSAQIALATGGILLIVGLVIFLIVSGNSQEEQVSDSNEKEQEMLPVVGEEWPSNTDKLVASYEKLENVQVTLNRISFTSNESISNGDSIAVYVYSTPKYVGVFPVMSDGDTLYIEGLEKNLKEIGLESGLHHLVLVVEQSALGYIEITIPKDFVTEEKTEEEEENASSTTQEENAQTNTHLKASLYSNSALLQAEYNGATTYFFAQFLSFLEHCKYQKFVFLKWK